MCLKNGMLCGRYICAISRLKKRIENISGGYFAGVYFFSLYSRNNPRKWIELPTSKRRQNANYKILSRIVSARCWKHKPREKCELLLITTEYYDDVHGVCTRVVGAQLNIITNKLFEARV